jgi:hypothetical protein
MIRSVFLFNWHGPRRRKVSGKCSAAPAAGRSAHAGGLPPGCRRSTENRIETSVCARWQLAARVGAGQDRAACREPTTCRLQVHAPSYTAVQDRPAGMGLPSMYADD